MTALAEGPGVISRGMSSASEQGDGELQDEGTPFPRLAPATPPSLAHLCSQQRGEYTPLRQAQPSLLLLCSALLKLIANTIFSYHHTVLDDAFQMADILYKVTTK